MRSVKLKELCLMKSGGTPSRKKPEFYNGSIPWAKISDLESSPDGFVYDTEEHITNDGLSSINNRLFTSNTLFLAMYGSVGKTAISKVEMSTNQAILGINIKDEAELDLYYLQYWFRTIKTKLLNRAVGGTLQNISLTIVKDLEIPLPPLEEQKKIAAILDAADEYRQKTKALIDKYDQLTQSLFLEMFGDPFTNPKGWRKASLGEIMISKTGSVNPLKFPNELFEYFSIPAFDKGLAEMTLGSSIGSSKKHFQPGDVLLSRIVPHIRRCWIVPENNGYRQIGSGEWIVFKSGDVNPNFLRFYLTSDFFHAQFMKTIKGVGGSLMRADISQVKRLKFYTPPHDVQLEFNEMVFKIEKQKQQAEASLVKAEELFNSLLQRAFKGELTS